MAGDWIAMRTDLADDPAVIGMAAALGLDEAGVIGRLHRLWAWADQQTTDGVVTLSSRSCHAASVTDAQHERDSGVMRAWIDKYLATQGFADAMIAVGWLDEVPGGVSFPNFDRWNSQTAKRRLLASKRQARRRADDGAVVTPESRSRHARVTNLSRSERDKSATRGEERRGDIEEGGAAASPPPRTTNGSSNSKQRERPEDVPIPPPLQTPEFLKAWFAWVAMRREQRYSLKAAYLRERLAELAALPAGQAIACLDYSRSNRYHGLFPEKFAGGKPAAGGRAGVIQNDLNLIREGLTDG